MKERDCVHRVPLFNHLTKDKQGYIQTLLQHKTFKKGELVFSPSSSDKLVIVSSGRIKVYILNKNGKEQVIRVIEAGDYSGENYLFEVQDEAIYGVALTLTEICILNKENFDKLLELYPQFSRNLLLLNTKKIIELEKQVKLLSFNRTDIRVAAYLKDLAPVTPHDSVTIDIPMPLKDLASYLGTSPETLSRCLKDFEANGWIKRVQRTVTIKQVFWKNFDDL